MRRSSGSTSTAEQFALKYNVIWPGHRNSGSPKPAMRITFTSDLHVDITRTNRALLPHLAEVVTAAKPDVFVIAVGTVDI